MRRFCFFFLLAVMTVSIHAFEVTLYSFTMTATADVSLPADRTGIINLISNGYATLDVSGTSVTYSQGDNDAVTYIRATEQNGVAGTNLMWTWNNTYLKVTLATGVTLQVGDVIQWTSWNNAYSTEMSFSKEAPRPTGIPATTEGSYTVTEGDAICGANSFYVWRAGYDTAGIHSLTITRPRDPETTTVTTNGANWCSFTPAYNCTLSNGARAYIVTNVDVENATLSIKTMGVLKAGEGYFIHGERPNTEYTATESEETPTVTTGSLLVGCSTNTDLTNEGNTKYFLGTRNDGVAGLYYVDNVTKTIPAGKCYLQSNSSAKLESLSLPISFEETGVNKIKAFNNHLNKKVFRDGHLYIGKHWISTF